MTEEYLKELMLKYPNADPDELAEIGDPKSYINNNEGEYYE